MDPNDDLRKRYALETVREVNGGTRGPDDGETTGAGLRTDSW